LPPEYFSRVAANSLNGMSWFQYDGDRIRPDDCISTAPPGPQVGIMPPVATFPARNEAIGMTFVPDSALALPLMGDAIVALHGFWATLSAGSTTANPATRCPPKVVAVRFAKSEAQRVEELVTGFQVSDGQRWARPMSVAIRPDGGAVFH
jgi:glucose/arabinose dehydrogenase